MTASMIVYYCGPPTTDYLVLRRWKGQRCKLQGLTEDTILVLSDYKQKEIFGVCKLRFWSDSCAKLVESTTRYDLFHIGVKDVFCFYNPIPYKEVKELMAGSSMTGSGNMWRRGRQALAPFQHGDGGHCVHAFVGFFKTLTESAVLP